MADPKRFIFIMVDTQRKDMLSCYGNPAMKTPNLDRLAEQGVRFERGYTCQPVCGPARSALFTGTYPHSNGSWGNTMPIGTTVKTVGERLSDQGVRTAYIGKWHLDGGDYFGMGQCPAGWDPQYWYDMKNYLDELPYEERAKSRHQSKNKDPDLNAEYTYANRCSNRAIDFLKTHGQDDFMLVLSYDEPHHPFVCPEPFASMHKETRFPVGENVKDDLKNKPEHQRAWAGGALNENRDDYQIMQPDFFGCNSFVDHEIGRVMEAIDTHAEDALIVYTSDHGDFLGAHRLNSKGPAMYDEITNVPFLMRWKGKAPVATTSESLVSHINVVPTALDYFGIAASPVLEGKSLLPLFKKPESVVDEKIFVEFGRYEIDHDGFGGFQPIRCVRDARYKLVINLLCSDELYDLSTDPGEMTNLIHSEEHKSIRDALHNDLLNWMNDTRDPFRGYYWERRPWRTDARVASWDYTNMTRQRVEEERYEPRQLDYATGEVIIEPVRVKG